MAEHLPRDELSDASSAEPDTTPRGWTRHTTQPAASPWSGRAGGSGRLLLFAAAASIAAGAVLGLGFRSDSQLTFELSGASTRGGAGTIEARRGEATVALSDGSSILAENGTRFQMNVVGRRAAVTSLLSGKLHVKVVPDEETSYRFAAGPYEVLVVGTELDIAWSEQGGLELSVARGEVRVIAAGRPLRRLRAGESLRLTASAAAAP